MHNNVVELKICVHFDVQAVYSRSIKIPFNSTLIISSFFSTLRGCRPLILNSNIIFAFHSIKRIFFLGGGCKCPFTPI